jgi:Bacteriophage probable baseplate hub protein
MAEHQGPRRYAACLIYVNGKDITDRLNPYLISVQVIDTYEGGLDQCNIELDDRNAELQIPPDDSPLEVYLGWKGEGPRPYATGGDKIPTEEEERVRANELPFGGPQMQLVFSGLVTSCESGFTRRGGGRRLWIEAKGANDKGPGKETQNSAWGTGKEDDAEEQQQAKGGGDKGASGGNGKSAGTGGGGGGSGGGDIPLQQVLDDMAKKAGVSVQLSPLMSMVKRDYWHVNESFHNFGQRMADELGGMFKVSGGVAKLIGKTEGVIDAAGTKQTIIDAVWGVNLIGWRIKPFSGRPQWSEASSKVFKLFDAEWDHIEKALGGKAPFGAANAVAKGINSVPNSSVGEQQNDGAGSDSESRRGTGWVLINGEPRAKAGEAIQIIGARPGVDGHYLMTEVEHNYTRGVGYQTRANVSNPQIETGYESWEKPPAKAEPQPEQPGTFKGTITIRPTPPEVRNQDAPPDQQPPVQQDDYVPGQAGEGGITFPE